MRGMRRAVSVMYEKEITSRSRTAFVIAVDCSRSMSEETAMPDGRIVPKSWAVAEAVDRIVCELIMRARRDGTVRDYYDIALLGYSDNAVFPMIDPRRDFIPVSEMESYRPAQRSIHRDSILSNGEHVVRTELLDCWVTPRSEGDTPMFEAFSHINAIVSEWCRRPCNADSFPPVIFNVTDGEASDCDADELRSMAGQIKANRTSDGNALLINIHISSNRADVSMIFPADEQIAEGDRYARLLADCSSIMPAPFEEMIRSQRGDTARPPFRAMGYNASVTELVTMLNIGSRSVTNVV